MDKPSSTWLERYRAVQRPVEVLFCIAVIAVQGVLNTAVTLVDMRVAGRLQAWWQPVLWEASSHLMVLLLIPAVVAWNRRFPLHWDTVRRHLPWHLAGSVLFSLVHVTGMVAIRVGVHASLGDAYTFGPWLGGWLYEYMKDVRAYMLIVGVLTAYRFLLLRLQGEARVLDAPEPPPSQPSQPSPPPIVSAPAKPVAPPADDGTPPPQAATPAATPSPQAGPSGTAAAPPDAGKAPAPGAPVRPERFLVRKLRKEFLIAASDIAWVQAQANYVGLRVNGHDYLLRSTLAEFARQLDPQRFVQVHRSYLVNLDRIAEIEPLDSGDARLRMRDGSQVPCSRRYRDALDPSRPPASERA